MNDVDVVVVGLGVMGAAALEACARRGLRAVGIERFDVPHAQGSSHGGTRITRKAYYEDPAYVPLLHEAWDLWRGFESELGATLLIQTGNLNFGAPEHPDMVGVMASVSEHALPHELLDAAAIRRRWPVLVPDAGSIGVFEQEAGCLVPELCVAGLVELAMRRGADVLARTAVTAFADDGARVIVRTTRGDFRAPKIVLALGAWMPDDRPANAPRAPAPLWVERQVQLWFAPVDRDLAPFMPGRMPVFISFGADNFYGLPFVRAAGPLGVKVCAHHGGEATHPEALDRTLRPADEALVRELVARQLPSANGALLGARVCMYTNTPDEHFVVGAHPDDARFVVATGFSGHGFKLGPAVGRALADAVSGVDVPVPLFDPHRFVSSPEG